MTNIENNEKPIISVSEAIPEDADAMQSQKTFVAKDSEKVIGFVV